MLVQIAAALVILRIADWYLTAWALRAKAEKDLANAPVTHWSCEDCGVSLPYYSPFGKTLCDNCDPRKAEPKRLLPAERPWRWWRVEGQEGAA